MNELMDVFIGPSPLSSLMACLGDIEERQIEGSMHLARMVLGAPPSEDPTPTGRTEP
ncbi:hypothetical protein ACT3TZ_02760 [Brachybacterium sp. AOP25-B2-12]|uniref:hypothetical protein n=1 Tax=Brachybacterium sp. AOP25-B2-12 TaxID=3457710 RepID=UPI004033BE8A